MAEIILSEKNFEEEVIKSDLPVLIDFWATWCGPCRMLAPVIEEISKEYQGKVKVGKVNVDDEPFLASRYQISSIPAVLLFKNGQVVNASIGFRPKEAIVDMLK